MRKHFSDIPRSNADTDTKPDADTHADTHADANTDTDTHADTHAHAHTHALAWADERHDNGEPEPGVADKPGRGRL